MARGIGMKATLEYSSFGKCIAFLLFLSTTILSVRVSAVSEENSPFEILKHSRYRPQYVAATVDEIVYTEFSERSCGKNLYRYSPKTRKEERLAVLTCVFEVKFANGKLYVNHKDGDRSRFDVWKDGVLEPIEDSILVDNLAEAQFALEEREEIEKADYGNPVPVRWSINNQEEVAVLFASRLAKKPIFVVRFSLKAKQVPTLAKLDIGGERLRDFRLSDLNRVLTSFVPEQEGALGDILLIEGDRIVQRFGSKSSSSDPSGWSVHYPESVSWAANQKDFVVTEGGGTHRYFLYHSDTNRFEKITIPGIDVASVVSYNDGYLVTKPQTRAILYVGPEFSNAEKWKNSSVPLAFESGKITPSYYFPSEYRDVCQGYSFAMQNNSRVTVSYFTDVELIGLGVLEGIESYDCGENGFAVIAKSFDPFFGQNQLGLDLKFSSDETNVQIPQKPKSIAAKRPLLFVFKGNVLGLVRDSYLDVVFSAVRFNQSESIYRVWQATPRGVPFDDWGHTVRSDGTAWKVSLVSSPPSKKGFALPTGENALNKKSKGKEGSEQ